MSMPAELVSYSLREYDRHMNIKKRELEPWEKRECAKLKSAIADINVDRVRADKITQQKIADAAGLEQGTVSNYLNGRLALNVGLAKVLRDEFEILPSTYSQRLADEFKDLAGAPSDSVTLKEVGGVPIKRVPIISSVQAGMWTAAYSHEYLDDQAEYQVTTLNVSESAFALRVQGDSMSNPYSTPSIPEGSIVIVEPHPDPDSGKIVVAMLDGSDEATIKKLQVDGPSRYLIPLNPKYPTMPINGNCRMIGFVKQVIQNL